MTIAVLEGTEVLSGKIVAPPSKSYTHRAVISSSLAEGQSTIVSPLYADDTIATINACTSFGASIIQRGTELHITGLSELKAPLATIDCKDSASTIRFLTPIAALARGKTVLDGSTNLKRRPIGPLIEALNRLGVQCSSNQGFPPVIVIGGALKGGRTSLVGDVSSQFVTGLLFACPLAREATEIVLSTPLESRPYVELTLTILRKHGIKMRTSKGLRRFSIPSNQHYTSRDHLVPGDFSSAAFILAAAVLTDSDIEVENLSLGQPDSEIVQILTAIGASVNVTKRAVSVAGGELRRVDIDARDIPDLVPICAVLACVSEGTTRIFGAKRLRIKESDRISAVSSELRKMGASIVETSDGLMITGPCMLRGATIDPHNDHRIAMACAIAGLKAKGKTKILEAECVNKSYPNFFRDLKMLGANIDVR